MTRQVDAEAAADAIIILTALRRMCQERQARYNLPFLTEGEYETLDAAIDGLGGFQPNYSYGVPDWTGSLKAALYRTS
ncbi:hypothetical protein [Mycobacteroides abscessus]|uniref:Uncharacterized protein n=1 Tax=Mycobacteroides abscessus 1948 TaxID=1299323 RepID=A0A829QJN1_9MYCO|nr:hypothetical protein [Mycobacteroides abscessus]EUA63047.1 hypothetical protein I542_3204 [Mycobacteroides abscessus 1948]EIU37093.1 hypothetical protein MA6G0125S_4544 [Mycobacteroides abscessus 6G-0125-S]EIU39735.1 hypothetical protein MA6G0125R_3497 [Mycobacteroides abscessus 6G-0125-R]EIU51994.1 hypothetical protein MA6G1108_4466 [Mycobacteroides abscessus 6G-1108]EIU53998.1 hypothetical protein MA6G0728S_4227 [Mycobacteroides abscessus 6G-0728-S]